MPVPFPALGRLQVRSFILSERTSTEHESSTCCPGADDGDGGTADTEHVASRPQGRGDIH